MNDKRKHMNEREREFRSNPGEVFSVLVVHYYDNVQCYVRVVVVVVVIVSMAMAGVLFL